MSGNPDEATLSFYIDKNAYTIPLLIVSKGGWLFVNYPKISYICISHP